MATPATRNIRGKKTLTKAQRENYRSKKQDEVKDLLAKLHAGVEKVSSSEDWKRCLRFQSAFHNYSFNNVMLIMTQMPTATRVAGYRKWQGLGRQVRKGEKALAILAPSIRKFEKEDKDGNVEEKRIVRFQAVKVFDVSQTEGDALPQDDLCKLLDGCDDQAAGLFEVLKAYAEDKLGYTVAKVESISDHPTANGICYMDRKAIEIADRPALQQAKTLAHEIGHAIMHSDVTDYITRERIKYMEVEAESVAFCLLGAFGLDSSDYSFGYVAGWSGGDPKKVERSGKIIQKAVTQVLEALENQVEIIRLRAENAVLQAA